MVSKSSILAVVALLAAAATAAVVVTDGDKAPVPTFRNLTRATLDDVRQGDWLLVVVAQWCSHSHSLVKDLPLLARSLYNRQKQVQVAVIDGEEDPSVTLQFSLVAYPYVCYVHNGEIHTYDGDSKYQDLLEWTLGKWESVEPLRGSKNPFGWQMTLLGAVAHYAWLVYGVVMRRAGQYNATSTAAFGTIFAVFAVTALVLCVCCVVRCEEKLVVPIKENKKKEQKKQEEKPKAKSESTTVRKRKTAKKDA